MKQIFRTVLVLLLVTGVTAVALAQVNRITKDRIADINRQKTAAALSAVLPDGDTAQEIAFTDGSGLVSSVYETAAGYAVEVKPAGFGGEIDLMVGVDREGCITGISVVKHTETAGLGAVAAEQTSKGAAFRDQFAGMSGTLAVTKDGGEVDAISGATVTSRAVTAGVNAALEWVREVEAK